MKNKLIGLAILLTLALPGISAAATTVYVVNAKDNSTSGGGAGLEVDVFAGKEFSILASSSDYWNAGDLPRWSNANGLTGDLIASGTADITGDNPGAEFDLVGVAFPTWTQNGLTAPYGMLVGQFGSGNFFKIGTSYTGTATDNKLKLFYFDSNNFDNTGSIRVRVTAVPEPETYAMMLAGLGMIGFMSRRRKNGQV